MGRARSIPVGEQHGHRLGVEIFRAWAPATDLLIRFDSRIRMAATAPFETFWSYRNEMIPLKTPTKNMALLDMVLLGFDFFGHVDGCEVHVNSVQKPNGMIYDS